MWRCDISSIHACSRSTSLLLYPNVIVNAWDVCRSSWLSISNMSNPIFAPSNHHPPPSFYITSCATYIIHMESLLVAWLWNGELRYYKNINDHIRLCNCVCVGESAWGGGCRTGNPAQQRGAPSPHSPTNPFLLTGQLCDCWESMALRATPEPLSPPRSSWLAQVNGQMWGERGGGGQAPRGGSPPPH